MSPLTAASAALGLLAAGYALGRLQPAHRASQWANRQHWGQRPTGLRYAAVWAVLSAKNIGWLLAHPVRGARAWKHRNDPPPPRSPALQFNPNWVAERRRATQEEV